MLLPSIDLQSGRAVQLRQGREFVLDAGDPLALAQRFSLLGEVAVVDLDAALGRGDNRDAIEALLAVAPCRVGGGIRTVEAARRWLDAGAERVVIGTAAAPELLRQLPRERVVAALDAWEGEVVVEGWRTRTGRSLLAEMERLRDHVGGFLVTFVEVEGTMTGLPLERAAALRDAAGDARLVVAGGVATAAEVAQLDSLGIDAQVGMALYRGAFDEADALLAMLRTDRADGRLATVVVDESGVALGLAWSSPESLRTALRERRGVYDSRSRGLWRKGETSGAVQELLRVDLDCDRDALRFVVRQRGAGHCHRGVRTCWGPVEDLSAIAAGVAEAGRIAAAGSYTARLLGDPGLLAAKIREEAEELVGARTRSEVVHEAADLLYFTMARLAGEGIDLEAVVAELRRRRRRVSRRGGEAKAAAVKAEPKPASTARPSAACLREDELLPVRALAELPSRRDPTPDAQTIAAAQAIVENVRTGGEAALRRHAERLGDCERGARLVIDPPRMRAALDRLPREDRRALEAAAGRIRDFAALQRSAVGPVELRVPGGIARQRPVPVETAGCYAPGGRHPLPSSVLMTALVARTAGVSTVVVASPRPAEATLAAAALAGADRLLVVGGAQAIAALAEGVCVPRCDVVVGPGNRWVTAAKRLVAGQVGIDLLAGPSELLVLADATADAELVAADLLAQAEHDPDARVWLATSSAALATAVRDALAAQVATLPEPNRTTAETALRRGAAIMAASPGELVQVADALAAEHLEIHCEDAEAIAASVRHAGGVFVGAGAAEVFGDYGFGPNHTLPTGGGARFAAGLSPLHFLRLRTEIVADAPVPSEAIIETARLARLEGLEAHARAALARAGHAVELEGAAPVPMP